MTPERRDQERFSLFLEAKISCRHREDKAPIIETVAANISSSGAYLKTKHKFPMAAKVDIEFLVNLDHLQKLKFILSMESLRKLRDDQIWVHTSGVVVRRDRHGVGIIFDTDYQLSPMRPSPPAS